MMQHDNLIRCPVVGDLRGFLANAPCEVEPHLFLEDHGWTDTTPEEGLPEPTPEQLWEGVEVFGPKTCTREDLIKTVTEGGRGVALTITGDLTMEAEAIHIGRMEPSGPPVVPANEDNGRIPMEAFEGVGLNGTQYVSVPKDSPINLFSEDDESLDCDVDLEERLEALTNCTGELSLMEEILEALTKPKEADTNVDSIYKLPLINGEPAPLAQDSWVVDFVLKGRTFEVKTADDLDRLRSFIETAKFALKG